MSAATAPQIGTKAYTKMVIHELLAGSASFGLVVAVCLGRTSCPRVSVMACVTPSVTVCPKWVHVSLPSSSSSLMRCRMLPEFGILCVCVDRFINFCCLHTLVSLLRHKTVTSWWD